MEKAIKYPNILKEYFMVYKNRFLPGNTFFPCTCFAAKIIFSILQ